MLFRIAAAALLTLALAVPAGADDGRAHPKAVLELFTSQGCSSCPEADALLRELGAKPDILALAYHVDYWDYIGWPDTFGAPANSSRQRDYAQSWGSSRIFTPQLIVNGTEGVVGSRRAEVSTAIGKAALELPVRLELRDEMLEIAIDGHGGLREAVVWLITYLDEAEVAIERGENEGKTLHYTQIVLGRQVLGMWDPENGARFKLPVDELMGEQANGAAVLVQEGQEGLPGRILGAASLAL